MSIKNGPRLDDTPIEDTIGGEYHAELKNLRIDKISQRLTLITFLIPIIIIVIMVVAYFDLKKRVTRIHDTGTTEVENLSQDLDSQFKSLLIKYKKLDQSFDKNIKSLDKTIRYIHISIKKIKSNVNDLTTDKVNKEDYEVSVLKINDTLKTINKELGSASSKMSKFQKEMNNGIDKLDNQIKNNLKKQTKKYKALSSNLTDIKKNMNSLYNDLAIIKKNNIDRNKLKVALQKEKMVLKTIIADMTEDVNNRLSILEKKNNIAKKSTKKKSSKNTTIQPPAKKTPNKTSGIIEKDIE